MLVEKKPWKKKYKNQETIFFIVNPFPPLEQDNHPGDRKLWAENELCDWLSKFLHTDLISCIKFPEWGPLNVILVYVLMDSPEAIEKYEGVHQWQNMLARADQSEELAKLARKCDKRMYSLVYAHFDSKEFKKEINRLEHSVKWISVGTQNITKHLKFHLRGASNLRDPRRRNQKLEYPLPEIPSKLDKKSIQVGSNYFNVWWVYNHVKVELIDDEDDPTSRKRKADEIGDIKDEGDEDDHGGVYDKLKLLKEDWE